MKKEEEKKGKKNKKGWGQKLAEKGISFGL